MASIVSVGARKTTDSVVEGGDTAVVLLLRCGWRRALMLLGRLDPGSVGMRIQLVVPVDVGGRHHLEPKAAHRRGKSSSIPAPSDYRAQAPSALQHRRKWYG